MSDTTPNPTPVGEKVTPEPFPHDHNEDGWVAPEWPAQAESEDPVGESVIQRIEAFVREVEAEGVRISGWDDGAAYFSHAAFSVRVSIKWDAKVHTVEVEHTPPPGRSTDG